MIDWLQDWASAIALVIASAVSAWITRVASKLAKHETRIAVLEHQVGNVPVTLEQIRDEIRGLRSDGEQRSQRIYQHLEQFRKEVKDDLRDKADKAA